MDILKIISLIETLEDLISDYGIEDIEIGKVQTALSENAKVYMAY